MYLSLCLGYRDALLAAPPAALTPFAVGGADPFITLTQLPALVPWCACVRACVCVACVVMSEPAWSGIYVRAESTSGRVDNAGSVDGGRVVLAAGHLDHSLVLDTGLDPLGGGLVGHVPMTQLTVGSATPRVERALLRHTSRVEPTTRHLLHHLPVLYGCRQR